MGEPIRSTRPLGEATPTYAFPRHEDRTQVLVADIDRVDAYAHSQGRAEPIWYVHNVDPADFLVDTPLAWPVDAIGYTFKHTLVYGKGTPPYFPRGGQRVRIVYVLWRTNDRGPIIIEHYAHYKPNEGFQELEVPTT